MAAIEADQTALASILVVDDSPGMQRLIRETLHLAGFHVHLASDGREALQLLEAYADIGLIITDVFMPVMDGMTFVAMVRDSNKTIPIIAISSISTQELKRQMLLVGATAWASKPLHPVRLVEIVKKEIKYG